MGGNSTAKFPRKTREIILSNFVVKTQEKLSVATAFLSAAYRDICRRVSKRFTENHQGKTLRIKRQLHIHPGRSLYGSRAGHSTAKAPTSYENF